MQLRGTRFYSLTKMCLISESLYRKVKTSVLNQTALSRQTNVCQIHNRTARRCKIRLKVCEDDATLNSSRRYPPAWRAA